MRIGYGISNVGRAASYVVYPPSAADPAAYVPLILQPPSDPDEGWTRVVAEDFEGPYLGCWTVEDNQPGYGEYYWGKRDCRSYKGNYSGWAVGAGSDGRSLPCGSYYPNDTYTWMTYGPFSLEDATAAELRVRLWLNTELDYDGVCRGVSIDGVNYYSYCTSGYSDGWIYRSLDLSDVGPLGDLTGSANIWVGLLFFSDYIGSYPEGVYLDSIVLRKYVSSTAAPPPALGAPQSLPDGARLHEVESFLALHDKPSLGDRSVPQGAGAQ